jgi:hypothetical protein
MLFTIYDDKGPLVKLDEVAVTKIVRLEFNCHLKNTPF